MSLPDQPSHEVLKVASDGKNFRAVPEQLDFYLGTSSENVQSLVPCTCLFASFAFHDISRKNGHARAEARRFDL